MRSYGIYNIMDFGAKADSSFDNTESLNKAVRVCNSYGGGNVVIPPGEFISGPVNLLSNVTLELTAGAKLLFAVSPDNYKAVKTRWGGIECYAAEPMIYGDNINNVSITGSGIIDGCGEIWWKEYKSFLDNPDYRSQYKIVQVIAAKNKSVPEAGTGGGGFETNFLRPPLIQFKDCSNITISGITAQNSAFWNTHILYSDNISIHNVKFINPAGAPNTDGLDIDSSSNVRISGCTFDVGDDCLCLKSGIDKQGREIGRPVENITVTGCTMMHGHGGIVFGSECAGGIRKVVVSDCIFNGTDRGIRIKNRRGRGGYIEDITVSNIVMDKVLCPLVFNMFYKCGVSGEKRDIFANPSALEITEETPVIRNFIISNIIAGNVLSAAAVFFGLPEMPVKGLRLINIIIEMDEVGRLDTPAMDFADTHLKKAGIHGKSLKGVLFSNISIKKHEGPAFTLESCSEIKIELPDSGDNSSNIKLINCSKVNKL
jgi:polygalacturonase